MDSALHRPITLLDDAPVSQDAFGGHQRVASAISGIIQSQSGGRAIALEGTWGSGKSSIIGMVKDQLPRDTMLVTFDAWSHEGDPLRLVFLEQLVHDAEAANWLTPAQVCRWEERFDEIRYKTQTKSKIHLPVLRWRGVFTAALVPLVPLAIALAALLAGLDPAVPFWKTTLPLWIPALLLLVILSDLLPKKPRRSAGLDAELRHRPFSSLLDGNSIGETITHTRGPDAHTSRAFEQGYHELLGQVLGSDEHRRIVLVIDNLDRLDTTHALAMWSTMRVFCDSSNGAPGVCNRTWVIVPFDRGAMQRLWSRYGPWDGECDEADHECEGTTHHDASLSFLDKTFSVRFDVPPLLLTDWKAALEEWVQKAIPDRGDPAEIETVYRLSASFAEDLGHPPTPRHLKLYVNDIGALVRQHGARFRLRSLAVYAILRRSGLSPEGIRQGLRDGRLPDGYQSELLGDRGPRELACLVFNTHDEPKALELLMRAPLAAALKHADEEAIRDLAASPAFGPSLGLFRDELVADIGTGLATVGNALHVICCVELWEDRSPGEVSDIRSLASQLMRQVEISSISQEAIDCLAVGIRAAADPANVQAAFSQLLRMPIEEGNAELYADGLVRLADAAIESEQTQFIPAALPLLGEAPQLVSCLSHLGSNGSGKDTIWTRIGLAKPEVNLLEQLSPAESDESLPGEHIAAIEVLLQSSIEFPWRELVEQCAEDLVAHPECGVEHAANVIAVLRLIERTSVEVVSSALAELAREGDLHSHLGTAITEEAWDLAAELTADIGIARSLTEPAQSGYQSDGDVALAKLIKAPETYPEWCYALSTALATPRLCAWLQACIGRGEAGPLITKILASIEIPVLGHALPAPFVIERWEKIRAALNGEGGRGAACTALVERLLRATPLGHEITITAFESAIADLYLAVLTHSPAANSEFAKFMEQGLRARSEEEWVAALRVGSPLAGLLWECRRGRARFHLGTEFQAAVGTIGKGLLDGSTEAGFEADGGLRVLDALGDSQRRVLVKQLRDHVRQTGSLLTEGFLTLFGQDLAHLVIREPERNDVRQVLKPALIGDVAGATEFVAQVLEAKPDLESCTPQDDWRDFIQTVRDRASKEDGDQAKSSINRVRDALGISVEDDAD